VFLLWLLCLPWQFSIWRPAFGNVTPLSCTMLQLNAHWPCHFPTAVGLPKPIRYTNIYPNSTQFDVKEECVTQCRSLRCPTFLDHHGVFVLPPWYADKVHEHNSCMLLSDCWTFLNFGNSG
jgi:hypothetical protein